MFRPISIFIGLRYTKAKKKQKFISFIATSSMLGIALSLMVLITVLSIFNGFDAKIKNRIFAMVANIQVFKYNGSLKNWQNLEHLLSNQSDIKQVAPYVKIQALLFHNGMTLPALINGISLKNNIYKLRKNIIAGNLDKLQASSYNVALGFEIANSLGLQVGDDIGLMTASMNITPLGIMPKLKIFHVAAIFKTGGGFGFDDSYVFANLIDVAKLANLAPHQISGLQVQTDDLFKAPLIAKKIQQLTNYQYNVSNWTQSYGSFYHAVAMEKSMMFLILILLVLIATFNLLSGLVMSVAAKHKDIAILNTLGLSKFSIIGVFIVQGAIIGIVGTIFGVLLGIILATHVNTVLDFLQNTFHIQLFVKSAYFVDSLPSQVAFSDVAKVSSIAIILSLLATIYPAWQVANLKPVEILRYE